MGGLRPFSWLKYFPAFGVQPIVVTRQWANAYGNELDYIAPGHCQYDVIEQEGDGYVIRTPYQPNLSNRLLLKYGASRFRLLRKTITAFYELAQFLLPVGPKRNIYKGARNYLKENKVDAIIATGDPFVLFHYAHKLSEEFNTPWIADYRDPWSTGIKIEKKRLLKFIITSIEQRIVKSAALVTTVSTYFKEKIEPLIKNKEIKIITNGFDDAIIKLPNNTNKNEILKIGYAGTIYSWHPLSEFLRCISKINKYYKVVEVHLIGTEKIRNECYAKYPQLEDSIFFLPKMEHSNVLIKLKEMDLLLLFNDFPIVGTKVYEWIALQRPILFCFEELHNHNRHMFSDAIIKRHKPQIEIIKNLGAGYVVKNEAELLNVLSQLINEFKQYGAIEYNGVLDKTFSRSYQAQLMIFLVKKISKK